MLPRSSPKDSLFAEPRCITVRRLPHYPLDAHCIAVRRLYSQPLLARCLSRTPYAALVVLEHSLCRSYYSGSDWHARMLYPFLSLEHLKVPVVRPFNSQALAQLQAWRQRLPRLYTTRRCCFWKRLALSLSIEITRSGPVTSKASRVLALQGGCCLMLH
jgi:hypothetical protein